MMDWNEFQKYMAAFTAWREASNQGRDGLRAIIHVIDNRAKDPRNRWPKSWAAIVWQFLQFSSITAPGDPEVRADRVPIFPDSIFADSYDIAGVIQSGGDFDLTNGATHYFNPSVVLPTWARTMTKVASIGQHDFYR